MGLNGAQRAVGDPPLSFLAFKETGRRHTIVIYLTALRLFYKKGL